MRTLLLTMTDEIAKEVCSAVEGRAISFRSTANTFHNDDIRRKLEEHAERILVVSRQIRAQIDRVTT